MFFAGFEQIKRGRGDAVKCIQLLQSAVLCDECHHNLEKSKIIICIHFLQQLSVTVAWKWLRASW